MAGISETQPTTRSSPFPALNLRLWDGPRASTALLAVCGVIVALTAIPLFYIVIRAMGVTASTWKIIYLSGMPGLFANTVGLTATVTAMAAAVGVGLAYIVERTDLGGVGWLRPLLAAPLAVPPYVGAICYVYLIGPRGLLEATLADFLGLHRIPFLSLIGFPAAFFVLSIFTYPYVYLLTSAALRRSDRSFEEAAHSLGLSSWRVFFTVTLPLLRPALGAGCLLVGLYVLSDFGAVSLTRTETFSSAIYFQLTGRFDRAGAAALSGVNMLLALVILITERRTRQRRSVVQVRSQWKPAEKIPLGRWRLPACAFIGITLVLSLGIPAILLSFWTIQGFSDQAAMLELWRISAGGLILSTWKSLWVSALAATAAVAAGLPIAFLMGRYRGLLPSSFYLIAQVGYALPAVVVALSMIFIFHAWAGPFYGTVWMLLCAYLIRFLPQSLQAEHASIAQISSSLEDAARSLGRKNWEVVREILLPLIAPGLLAGWSLVFLSTLRELPATLLLRPAGFDTLPILIWTAADEGVYIHSAPAALLLIAVSAVPLYLLLSRGHLGAAEKP
ncbi:MAG: iron ABC transporter permease [bacterium]